MDLIYTNSKREDAGVLLAYELDLSFGSSENDFELKVSNSGNVCEAGGYIYIQGTEYGGIIDAVESDTANAEVTYSGRTWHGILNSHIFLPDAGQDYLTVSGEANAVLASLVKRCGLDDLFTVSAEDSGITIPTTQMNLYIEGYSGICKVLQKAGAKLLIRYGASGPELSAAKIADYSQDGVDSDVMDFTAKRSKGKVNHLICLGKGELKNRLIVHLYADEEGNISTTQSLFGANEYATTYEYSSVDDAEELTENGKDRFAELQAQDELNVTINDTSELYDIGDIVGASDSTTGISVAVTIQQKIVTIKDGTTEVSYSTEITNTSSVTTSSGGSSGGSDISVVTKSYGSSSFWCDAGSTIVITNYTPEASGTYMIVINVKFASTVTGRAFLEFCGRRTSLPVNTPYPYDDVIYVGTMDKDTAYSLLFYSDTGTTYTYEGITVQSIKLA